MSCDLEARELVNEKDEPTLPALKEVDLHAVIVADSQANLDDRLPCRSRDITTTLAVSANQLHHFLGQWREALSGLKELDKIHDWSVPKLDVDTEKQFQHLLLVRGCQDLLLDVLEAETRTWVVLQSHGCHSNVR